MSAYVIEGATGPWELVIGLEVHAQVVSKAKLFSGASAEYGAEPNSQVSFVDAAFPGMLPALNGGTWTTALVSGAILGAVAYGTYDMTNLATLKDWSIAVSGVDMAWGTVLTALAATAGYVATRQLAG